MDESTVRYRRAPEITSDDLFAAYKRGKLRSIGVSYATAIMTPLLRTALRLDAQEAKKKQKDAAEKAAA